MFQRVGLLRSATESMMHGPHPVIGSTTMKAVAQHGILISLIFSVIMPVPVARIRATKNVSLRIRTLRLADNQHHSWLPAGELHKAGILRWWPGTNASSGDWGSVASSMSRTSVWAGLQNSRTEQGKEKKNVDKLLGRSTAWEWRLPQSCLRSDRQKSHHRC